MHNDRSIVSVRNLNVAYRSRLALDGLSVDFPSGATGLLGVNGAGKTTLILAMLAMLDRVSGDIIVLGKDVFHDPLSARALVGYSPERDSTVPDMNAVDSVAYCGMLYGLPAIDALQRAHELLDYVGLGEARYAFTERFSAGMKQRLKIAQALVHDPLLLILDEPTNGLDPRGRDQLLSLLSQLARRPNRHLILSSHILPDVERVCTSFVLLNAGRLAAAGGVSDTRDTQPCEYEVAIKGDPEAFTAALERAGVSGTAGEDGGFTVRSQLGPRLVFAAAHACGSQIRRLQRRRITLESLVEQALAETTAKAIDQRIGVSGGAYSEKTNDSYDVIRSTNNTPSR